MPLEGRWVPGQEDVRTVEISIAFSLREKLTIAEVRQRLLGYTAAVVQALEFSGFKIGFDESDARHVPLKHPINPDAII